MSSAAGQPFRQPSHQLIASRRHHTVSNPSTNGRALTPSGVRGANMMYGAVRYESTGNMCGWHMKKSGNRPHR